MAKKINKVPAHNRASIERVSKKDKPQLFSAIYSDGSPTSLGQLQNAENPKNKKEAFKQARTWRLKNFYVWTILDLKLKYSTFGMQVQSADPSKQEQFEKWLTGNSKKDKNKDIAKASKKQLRINKFIRDCHEEGWLMGNIAPLWFTDEPLKSDFPTLLNLEDCTYSDFLGIEKMIVDFKIGQGGAVTKAQLAEAGLSAELIDRYSKPVALSEDYGEYYIVWSSAKQGSGFAFPKLYSVFRTCSQQESMEVGESLLAYSGRLVSRIHRKGFEPRTSSVGLKRDDFMWTAEWAAEVKKTFSPGKNGFIEATASFDHSITTHWVDPKYYDASKWDTTACRMIWWAGPLGFMLLAKSNSPNWMTLYETEIKSFQADITPYIEFALNAVYADAPGGIKICYTDTCFKDQRLVWDMLKTLLMTGPASLTTAMKKAGLDVDQEGENRKHEAGNKDVFGPPIYDPAHATNDGKKPKGGRQTGSRDGDNVQ